MRRTLRMGGLLMIVGGVLCLLWVVVVWRWQDPITALQTRREQGRLADQYERLVADWRPSVAPPAATGNPPQSAAKVSPQEIARDASAFRSIVRPGQAIGRIEIQRLGLSMMVVEGTDTESLKKGPGRDPRTFMPGENRLVYVAGHRTTYLAPFAHIDAIEPGDEIRLAVPYATFVYRALGHEIVPADAISRLRSPPHELLRLQACHPRFFASHRYLVDARLVRVEPQAGRPYEVPLASSG
jgi:sortase A